MNHKIELISDKNKKKSELFLKINILKNQQRELELEIDNISKEILEICDHNWVRDDCSYGPYEKPDYVCTICHSIDYRW